MYKVFESVGGVFNGLIESRCTKNRTPLNIVNKAVQRSFY